MLKPVFCGRFLAIMISALIFGSMSLPIAFCQETAVGEAARHNQRGLEYFNKGFYEHEPKNQRTEVARNYGLAVNEFNAAISKDPSCVEAHRSLARVYLLQKNFEGALKECQRVIDLAPGELDAYVNLALAFIELKRPDEAIQTLENAKVNSSDPKATATLDAYLTKIRVHQAEQEK